MFFSPAVALVGPIELGSPGLLPLTQYRRRIGANGNRTCLRPVQLSATRCKCLQLRAVRTGRSSAEGVRNRVVVSWWSPAGGRPPCSPCAATCTWVRPHPPGGPPQPGRYDTAGRERLREARRGARTFSRENGSVPLCLQRCAVKPHEFRHRIVHVGSRTLWLERTVGSVVHEVAARVAGSGSLPRIVTTAS